MRRASVVGVVLLVVCSSLAGCSSSSSGSHSVELPHGVSIQVPANAGSFTPSVADVPGADSSLLASVPLPGGGTGPSPFVSLATPVHLTSTGPFPKGGVTLSFHTERASVPSGMSPFIATYVPSSGIWSPVVSHYDPASGEVSAHVAHFSIWGVFSFAGAEVKKLVKVTFGELFGSIKVTDPPPTCGDSTGLTSVMTPPNGDLEVCTQNGANGLAILKVRSFLAFPIDIDYFSGEQVSVTPPGGLFTEIGGALNNASDGKAKGTVIVAGSEADVSVPLAPGASRRVFSNLDTLAYLTGIIESGVNVLSLMEAKLGKNPKAVLDAIAQGKCADEVSQLSYSTSPINLSALDQLTQTAIDCASTVVDLGVGGTIDAIIGTVDGLIENVLQSAFGAAMLIVGGPNGTDTAITMTRTAVAPAPEVPSASVPTLGTSFAPSMTGFGAVKPATVQYGGDGYSQAQNITWQSWGGAQAIGTGTGWYVPDGQSRDTGSNAPITVVAFNLGTCGGIPAYQSFSWYFPQNGESFNPSYYLNACTGQLIVPTTSAASSCPSPDQLFAAWTASPGIDTAAPGSVTGFNNVQCWSTWVVTLAVGNGNGQFVFSEVGGLHGVTEAELAQFTSQVCSDPTAPQNWNNPANGPVNCSG